MGEATPFSGLNGLREAGLDWFAPMATYRREIKQIIIAGNGSWSWCVSTPPPRGSAGEIVIDPAHLLTFRDGKIAFVAVYLNRSEALEAVGLSEQDAHADS